MGLLIYQLVICLVITSFGSDTLVHGEQTEAERTVLANIKLVGEEIVDNGVFLMVEFTAFYCSSHPVCRDYRYDVKVYDSGTEDNAVRSATGKQGEVLTVKTNTLLPLRTESYNYDIGVCITIGKNPELCTEYVSVNRKAAGPIQKVEAIFLTHARLSWVVPSSVAYFIVSWENSADRLCIGEIPKKEVSGAVYDNRCILKNLSPATSWKVSVSSFSGTRKTFTAIIHFSTKGVEFRRVKDTAATVEFRSTTCPDFRQRAILYILNIGMRRIEERCDFGDLCVVEVPDLEPLTEYTVKIASVFGEDKLNATTTLVTKGDAAPLNVKVTDTNELSWNHPYLMESFSIDDLTYVVSCSSANGWTENKTIPLKKGLFRLDKYGVLYKCSLQMTRGSGLAGSPYAFQKWAVSKAVKSTFGLPQNGIQTINGTNLLTVKIPQLVQEGVSVSFYTVTVSTSPPPPRYEPKQLSQISPAGEGASSAAEGTCSGPAYIAVKLRKDEVSTATTVIVGAGTTEDGINNRLLLRNCRYSLRVTVVDERGVAVFSDEYSGSYFVSGANISPNKPAADDTGPSPAVLGIVVFISICLVIAVIAGVRLWRKRRLATTRKPHEDREMTVSRQVHASESSNPVQIRPPQARRSDFPRQAQTAPQQGQVGPYQPTLSQVLQFDSDSDSDTPYSPMTAPVAQREDTTGHRNSSPPRRAWNGSVPVAFAPCQVSDGLMKRLSDKSPEYLHDEFQELPRVQVNPETASAAYAVTQNKNRYRSIFPYDWNRVVLRDGSTRATNDPDADYINASYIRQFSNERKFIATQGPTETTIPAFWRMVVQESVKLIIMLAKFVELGKKKCEEYFPVPKGNSFTHGDVHVRCTCITETAFYTYREFHLTSAAQAFDPFYVDQYQFTAWPDHYAPQPNIMVKFHSMLDVKINKTKTPVIVHCSAGVGRTGTFIALDTLIRDAKFSDTFNIFEVVSDLRRQRTCMVQAAVQYEFLHQALLEKLSIPEIFYNDHGHLARDLDASIMRPDTLIAQHKIIRKLTKPLPKERCSTALCADNRNKNRSLDIVPENLNMPYLTTFSGNGEYINATIIKGYRHYEEDFLLTERPLSHMVFDFWRLILEKGIKTAISVVHQSDPHHLWDVERIADPRFGGMKIEVVLTENVAPSVDLIVLRISYAGKEVEVDYIQIQSWKITGDYPPPADMLNLYRFIRHIRATGSGNRTMILQCRDGASQCGLIAILFNCLDQLGMIKGFEVAHTSRAVTSCRPAILKTQEDYIYVHQAVYEWLRPAGEENLYANIEEKEHIYSYPYAGTQG